jgi:hypothetical protein
MHDTLSTSTQAYSSMSPIRVLTAALPLTDANLARLRARFPVVHYHPHPQPLPAAAAAETEVIFCSGAGLPPNVASIGQTSTHSASGTGEEEGKVHLPKVRHVQLGSAGANRLLDHAAIKRYAAAQADGGKAEKGAVSISTASGTHVLSIPPWVVGQLIGCWHQFSRMYDIQRVRFS